MKVSDLKIHLTQHGLNTTGKKKDLAMRLVAALARGPTAASIAPATILPTTTTIAPSTIPPTSAIAPAIIPATSTTIAPTMAIRPALGPEPSMINWTSKQVRAWLGSLSLKPEWQVDCLVTEGSKFASYSADDIASKTSNVNLGRYIWQAKEKKLRRSIDQKDFFFASLALARKNECWLTIPNVEDYRFYIRNCWERFYTLITENWGRKKHTLVTGTPGIGKTTFLWYLMWNLLQAQGGTAQFVLDQSTSPMEREYVEYQDYTLVQRKSGTLHEELNADTAFYLVDGAIPYTRDSLTLEVSSPKKSRWQNFAKGRNVAHYVMPSWSLDELKSAASVLDPEFERQLLPRYEWLGGVYRYMLTHLERAPEKVVEIAIQNLNLVEFIYRNGDVENDEMSNQLVHLHPSEDEDFAYDSVLYDFASRKIASQVREKLKVKIKEQYLQFVTLSGTNVYYGTLQGRVFEDMAQEVLAAGGTFKVRLLSPPKEAHGSKRRKAEEVEEVEEELILKKAATVVSIHSLEDLKRLAPDAHGKPASPQFPSFDCFRQPNMAFQMMTALRHGFKIQGVRSVLKHMSIQRIYCVVPEGLRHRVKWQPYKDKNIVLKEAPKDVEYIEQWVLGIPVPL